MFEVSSMINRKFKIDKTKMTGALGEFFTKISNTFDLTTRNQNNK